MKDYNQMMHKFHELLKEADIHKNQIRAQQTVCMVTSMYEKKFLHAQGYMHVNQLKHLYVVLECYLR